MKKTVVVDLEYMRPSVGRRGSRSRSRSRSQSRSRSVKRGKHNVYEDEELNINALLNKHQDDYESDENESEPTISDDEDSDGNDNDEVIDSSDSEIESDTSPPRIQEQRIHPSVKDSDYAVDSDEDLLQSVLDEPTFPLDINAILSAMNKTENNTR